jgi:hypothetical protein
MLESTARVADDGNDAAINTHCKIDSSTPDTIALLAV